MKKTSYILLVALVLTVSWLSSCKKQAPALPPESTFVLPKMDTDTSTKSSEIAYTNIFWASSNVSVWTTIIEVGLLIPKTAFVAALTKDPQHVSGDQWVWEYQITALLHAYTVQLYGSFVGTDSIKWEMHISQVGGFQDFTWFYGMQDKEGTAGYWILYKSPTEDHELLRIDWTKDLTDSLGSLKYTNIEPESTENGGYISYGNNQDGTYNCYYDIFNKGQNNLTEIDYNTTTHVGRIMSPAIYLDSIWHCWNERFVDDFCPNLTTK